MDKAFWTRRWHKNEIAFHENQPNHQLVKHWPPFITSTQSTVLLPLCGKSTDLLWLAEQGHTVIGVELIESAVEDFWQSCPLPGTPNVEQHGAFRVYRHPRITIYQGDWFEFDPANLGLPPMAAVYDRAALIALPSADRKRYAAHLRHITQCPIFLLNLDYPQHERDGPPFSVSLDEVRTLYEPHYTITVIADQEALSPRFKAQGVSQMTSQTILLHPIKPS